jgi:ADP-heptose:LPS heptosyltransferase
MITSTAVLIIAANVSIMFRSRSSAFLIRALKSLLSMIHSAVNLRPLVIRYGALGDMVILTVLIRHLHARFGQPVDIIASGGWTKPLLQGQPGVGDLTIVSSRKRPYWFSLEQQQLVRYLRQRGPSATWLSDYENDKTRWLLQRAGWEAKHWCEMRDTHDAPGPHQCDQFLRFAYRNPAIVSSSDSPLLATDAWGQLQVTDLQRVDLDTWLRSRQWQDRSFILVQPGNKRTMRRGARQRASNSKYWPEQNWALVLQGLRERYPDDVILMMGVPQEAELNEEILQLSRVGNAFNVATDLPVPRLIALAQRARGMISVDTGPAHVAAAVGCSVVTLFGKASPQMYAPRGHNTLVKCLTGIYDGEQSMLGITSEQVLRSWDEVFVGKS